MPEFLGGKIFIAMLIVLSMLEGCSPEQKGGGMPKDERKLSMNYQAMSEVNSGYRSSELDWEKFLSCWRAAVVNRISARSENGSQSENMNNIARIDSPEYIENKALVEKGESRLGKKLPKSYRDFLAITGGRWWIESAGYAVYLKNRSHLVPADSLGAFRIVDAVNWNVWSEALNGVPEREVLPSVYYRYGYSEEAEKRQDFSQLRWKQLNEMVKVGELEQGAVILINPSEVSSDGEWEAWVLSPQLAGAARYRSFAELMQHLAYQDILELGGSFHPSSKLTSTCAKFIKTAANE